jgi:hypothetical protein
MQSIFFIDANSFVGWEIFAAQPGTFPDVSTHFAVQATADAHTVQHGRRRDRAH